MTQAVCRQPLNAEAWVYTWVSPCGICGGQSGTGTRFSPSSLDFPCQYHSIMALHFFSLFMGWDYISELLPLTDILLIPQMINEYGEWWWNDIDRGKLKNSEKTCPSATCPPQIPHGLTQAHMALHSHTCLYHPGDEQNARWWPWLRGIISTYQHKDHDEQGR
jgi:hypothetical protein